MCIEGCSVFLMFLLEWLVLQRATSKGAPFLDGVADDFQIGKQFAPEKMVNVLKAYESQEIFGPPALAMLHRRCT